jgi:hypothetical protein
MTQPRRETLTIASSAAVSTSFKFNGQRSEADVNQGAERTIVLYLADV